jgi:plastocyanin
MIATRRGVLLLGGGIAAALSLRTLSRPARAEDFVEIEMHGLADGSDVWFDPIGIHVEPGRTVRWTNRNPGNVHTSTAYHPSLSDRPQRIPDGATPWDSDYLMPDQSFTLTLTVPGVYDYYCIPHEHAGMVGRIVVGTPPAESWMQAAGRDGDIPEIALRAFPDVEAIVRDGIVRRG